ncbi:MAG: hypothetical protein NZ602_10345 [Thermoguttaceae bacterium]|nr:hypothetical protein [Thermoguttaceae bacterium]
MIDFPSLPSWYDEQRGPSSPWTLTSTYRQDLSAEGGSNQQAAQSFASPRRGRGRLGRRPGRVRGSFSLSPLRERPTSRQAGRVRGYKILLASWAALAAMLLDWAGVGPAWAAEPGQFRFWKQILPSPLPEENIFAVPLDNDVYAEVQDGFPDIRLFDSRQRETPYLLEKAFTTVTEYDRTWTSARVETARELENNRLEIVLSLPPSINSADGIQIQTPLRDFERQVQVFGSDNGQQWTLLVKDGLLYDYSRYIDVRGLELRLPPNKHRFFKLLIEEITDTKDSPWTEITRKIRQEKEWEKIERFQLVRRPLRIDLVQVWSWVPRTEKRLLKTHYHSLPFQVQEDSKNKCTIIQVQTRRQPLERFVLKTASRNFYREISVQIPVPWPSRPVRRPDPLSAALEPAPPPAEPSIEWRTIATGRIHLLRFRHFHEENLQIDFSEQRSPQYRLLIHNQDSPPIEITGVDAAGPVYQVVFLGQPQESYQLYYGANSVGHPQYDIAHVLTSLRSGAEPVQAKLQAQANTQTPQMPPAQPRPLSLLAILNHPLFFLTAIVVVVIILAWGLIFASRRIQQLPQDKPPSES